MRFLSFFFFGFFVASITSKGASYPPGPFYGTGGASNQLIQPSIFTIGADDWSPVVISGAGTAGANGNYYLSVSNFVAGVGHAVFTNANGSAYRLVFNNTNFVTSLIVSNYWTIENTINVNINYEIVSPTPFGTWSISSSGGTSGVAPVPTVGTHLPSLITASLNLSSGNLVLTPGVYDIGYYAWFPTNLTVIAHGATVQGFNAVDMIHPYGSFKLYGGTFTNGHLIGGTIGGTLLQITHITNSLVIHDATLFGPTDGLFGNFNADNTVLDFIGNDIGGWWDTIVVGKASGLTNVTGRIIGNHFWSRTNQVSAMSIAIGAQLNYVSIAGNVIEQGIGFTGGSGINIGDANTTNEINGNVIRMQAGVTKIVQSAGRAIVNGSPYDPSDYSGTVTFSGTSWYSKTNSMTAQTITVGASVYTNMGNNLTFSGLTATPTGNYEGTGTATLLSNGADRTVVTPVSWHCSDYVSTRTLTNGNQMVVSVKVIPGISTNAAIAQFK